MQTYHCTPDLRDKVISEAQRLRNEYKERTQGAYKYATDGTRGREVEAMKLLEKGLNQFYVGGKLDLLLSLAQIRNGSVYYDLT